MSFWFSKKKTETADITLPAENAATGTTPSTQTGTGKISEAANIDGLLLPADVAIPAAQNAAAATTNALSATATEGLAKEAHKVATLKPGSTSAIRPQQSQKALYYQLMNGLYDAILIMGEQGHVIDCNQRCTPTLGYEREEMWDKHISEFVKGITPKIFADMKKALDESRQVLITARCTRKDGTNFTAEVGVSIMNLNGTNLVFSIRNIEKRLAKMRIKAPASHP